MGTDNGASPVIAPHVQGGDDIASLLAVLPPDLRAAIDRHPDLDSILEIVLDLGRRPEARFPGSTVWLAEHAVGREHLAEVQVA